MKFSKILALGFTAGMGFHAAERVWWWLGGLAGLCYG